MKTVWVILSIDLKISGKEKIRFFPKMISDGKKNGRLFEARFKKNNVVVVVLDSVAVLVVVLGRNFKSTLYIYLC